MKTVNGPGGLTYLQGNPPCLRAELLTITLANGQILRAVLDGAADLTYGGATYYATANGVWSRDKVTSEAMRGELKSNSTTLTVVAPETVMFPGTAVPLSQSFVVGVWDAAPVVIAAVYMPPGEWGGANVQAEMNVFSGMVSDSQGTGRSKGTLTVHDYLYLANTQVPQRRIQPGCFSTFGDAACTFALSGIGLANTVGGAFTPVTIPPATAFPSSDSRGNSIAASYSGVGYFANGKLQWTSGNNTGFWSHIQSFTAGVLILSYPPPFPIAEGDGFTAYGGCQKTITDCATRWGNQANFTGFPVVPVPETSV